MYIETATTEAETASMENVFYTLDIQHLSLLPFIQTARLRPVTTVLFFHLREVPEPRAQAVP